MWEDVNSKLLKTCWIFLKFKILLDKEIKMCILDVCIYSIPPPRAGCDTRSSFWWNETDLNSKISFTLTCCLTKTKEPNLSHYLPITGRRFMPFSRALAPSETQTALSRNWTRVTVTISNEDNRYTKGATANHFKLINLASTHIKTLWGNPSVKHRSI